MKFASMEMYEGNWKDNKYSGNGNYTWKEARYSG